jgi:competence protein ComEA
VDVPVIGVAGSTQPTAGASRFASGGATGGPVDINTATQEMLESLPGIGPTLAQRIIDYRQANGPFASIEAIQDVSGIGPGIFEKIKDLITVR